MMRISAEFWSQHVRGEAAGPREPIQLEVIEGLALLLSFESRLTQLHLLHPEPTLIGELTGGPPSQTLRLDELVSLGHDAVRFLLLSPFCPVLAGEVGARRDLVEGALRSLGEFDEHSLRTLADKACFEREPEWVEVERPDLSGLGGTPPTWPAGAELPAVDPRLSSEVDGARLDGVLDALASGRTAGLRPLMHDSCVPIAVLAAAGLADEEDEALARVARAIASPGPLEGHWALLEDRAPTMPILVLRQVVKMNLAEGLRSELLAFVQEHPMGADVDEAVRILLPALELDDDPSPEQLEVLAALGNNEVYWRDYGPHLLVERLANARMDGSTFRGWVAGLRRGLKVRLAPPTEPAALLATREAAEVLEAVGETIAELLTFGERITLPGLAELQHVSGSVRATVPVGVPAQHWIADVVGAYGLREDRVRAVLGALASELGPAFRAGQSVELPGVGAVARIHRRGQS